ncbi:MAG: NmrA family NAD(P)-binding protein [Maritimibacter sp.]
MRLLILGATGNVGMAVLSEVLDQGHEVVAGVRDSKSAAFGAGVKTLTVDLTQGPCSDNDFDAVFLMRPPALSDVRVFRRFLEGFSRRTRIVFLSTQGADRRAYLPHAKIEAVLEELGFETCAIRPAYFMENLTTTLAPELRRSGQIYLPAGALAMDWVSVRDVAQVAAAALLSETLPPATTVATGRGLGFAQALSIINTVAGTQFTYVPASLLGYLRDARKNGLSWGLVAVMYLLHALPRLRRSQIKEGDALALLGRPYETLEEWAARNGVALRQIDQDRARHAASHTAK